MTEPILLPKEKWTVRKVVKEIERLGMSSMYVLLAENMPFNTFFTNCMRRDSGGLYAVDPDRMRNHFRPDENGMRPCYVCGSRALRLSFYYHSQNYAVVCMDCGSTASPRPTRELAESLWNDSWEEVDG